MLGKYENMIPVNEITYENNQYLYNMAVLISELGCTVFEFIIYYY